MRDPFIDSGPPSFTDFQATFTREQVGSYAPVDMKKTSGKNRKNPYSQTKTQGIVRKAATRRKSLISNTRSQSLYEWYEYLKQSGRFSLSD